MSITHKVCFSAFQLLLLTLMGKGASLHGLIEARIHIAWHMYKRRICYTWLKSSRRQHLGLGGLWTRLDEASVSDPLRSAAKKESGRSRFELSGQAPCWRMFVADDLLVLAIIEQFTFVAHNLQKTTDIVCRKVKQ